MEVSTCSTGTHAPGVPTRRAWSAKYAEVSWDAIERLRSRVALEHANAELERRVAERTAERDLLSEIVSRTDLMIMASDFDYNILAINRATADEFERVFGMRPSVGENMLGLLAGQPKQQAEVRSAWARGLAGEEFTFVEQFGDRDRVSRPYYRSDVPARFGTSRVGRSVATRS